MLRENVINFLEAAVLFLLLTNAFSAVAAAYAISLARGVIRPGSLMTAPHGFRDTLGRCLGIGK
jgi:hypothetical protein